MWGEKMEPRILDAIQRLNNPALDWFMCFITGFGNFGVGRGGADGDSEDEENRGDGLHRVAVVWLLCGVLSAPSAQIRVCIWRQGRKRFADETY